MKVRMVLVFVIVATLLSATIAPVRGQERRPEDSTNEGQVQETAAILSTVEEYFHARLQVRLGRTAAVTLERFFDRVDPDALEALRREAAKAVGFLARTERVGPPVQDGRVEVEVLIQRLDGLTADVAVQEMQSYLIRHPTLGERTAKQVFDHVLRLALKDRWLIVRDDYLDPGGDAMLSRGDFTSLSTIDVPDPLGTFPDRRAGGDVGPEVTYNRIEARNYADDYWDDYNATYKDFCPSGGDCANFASQVVFEGGGYPKKWTNPYQWWYDQEGTPGDTTDDTWSSSWVGVSSQRSALDYHYGNFVASATSLNAGDLVYMDWTGNGSWDHVTIVVVADPEGGNPLLNAHCNDRYHVALSSFGAARTPTFTCSTLYHRVCM